MRSSMTTTSQQVCVDAFLGLGTALGHCCPRDVSALAKCTPGVHRPYCSLWIGTASNQEHSFPQKSGTETVVVKIRT
jgi:hypothetical protein